MCHLSSILFCSNYVQVTTTKSNLEPFMIFTPSENMANYCLETCNHVRTFHLFYKNALIAYITLLIYTTKQL